MRARLIVNPSSGTDRAPILLPSMAARLRTLADDLDITISTGEADVTRAATRAVEEGCDLLFVAGGDGTLNIAVRAVARREGGLERVVFGLIPLGTGNDFAKAIGLGEEPEAALDMLLSAHVVDVDLGTLNGQVFVNISAGGFVADVSAATTEPLKDAAGKLAFVIGGARALFGREAFAASIGPAAEPLQVQMFLACNGRFIGGGREVAPSALVDDGLLDVYVVKAVPTLEFVALLQKMGAGQHDGDERIVRFRTADVELAFDRVVNVNMDGELLQADRCRYGIRHRAARFLCGPRPLTTRPPRALVV